MKYKGVNKALIKKAIFTEAVNNDICFFISYSHKDSIAAKHIGDYLMNSGFNIYLDMYDNNLQLADKNKNSELITKYLENGIDNSTRLLCLISNSNNTSWWVPYELGYAKKASKKIVSLKLKGEIDLPDYLKISTILEGTKSLNSYLQKLLGKIISERIIFKTASHDGYLTNHNDTHPLDNYLDYNK